MTEEEDTENVASSESEMRYEGQEFESRIGKECLLWKEGTAESNR